MQLSDRERKLVLFGGGFLLLFIVAYFTLFSDDSGPDEQTTFSSGKSELDEIMKLYRDFANVQSEYNRIEAKINDNKNFSLLSELETLASDNDVAGNIESMESKSKPKNEFFKEEAVDIRFFKVTLRQLISFMYAVEYSPKILRVKKVHFDVRSDNADLLNAELEVSTFMPLET